MADKQTHNKYIYPIDVSSSLNKGAQSTTSALLSLFILVDVVVFFVILFIFGKFLNLSFIWTVLAFLALNATVGVLIFRFAIFKEKERENEEQSSGQDAFGKYYNLRRDTLTPLKLNNGDSLDIYEFNDGSFYCGFQFRFGSNNRNKAINTKQAFRAIYNILGNYKAEIKILTMKEKFESTDDYQTLVDRINDTEDIELRHTVLRIANIYLDNAVSNSNVNNTVLMFRVNGLDGIGDIQLIVESILTTLASYGNETGLREVLFVDKDILKSTIMQYYGLEVFDPANMKNINLTNGLREQVKKEISIFRIGFANGGTVSDRGEVEAIFNAKLKNVKDLNNSNLD